MTFHAIAPSRPARITFGFTMLCSIIPPPTALATAREPVKAAAKLNTAAQMTAASGLNTRVPTIVAMEFAESWKPLLKSKMNAIRMIATTYAITGRPSSVLERNALQHLRDAHAAVDGAFQRVVHVLPLQNVQRIRVAGEERTHRLVIDGVAFLLEVLDQRDVLVYRRRLSHLGNRPLDLDRRATQHPGELSCRRKDLRDVQHLEASRRAVDQVDHVVETCRE